MKKNNGNPNINIQPDTTLKLRRQMGNTCPVGCQENICTYKGGLF